MPSQDSINHAEAVILAQNVFGKKIFVSRLGSYVSWGPAGQTSNGKTYLEAILNWQKEHNQILFPELKEIE